MNELVEAAFVRHAQQISVLRWHERFVSRETVLDFRNRVVSDYINNPDGTIEVLRVKGGFISSEIGCFDYEDDQLLSFEWDKSGELVRVHDPLNSECDANCFLCNFQ